MKKHIKYVKVNYKYLLDEDYYDDIPVYPARIIETPFIKLSPDGQLAIRKWYAWDGASGPTIDTKSSMRASLIHDALYQLMRLKLLEQSWRYQADKILKDVCIEDGMFKVRANLWFIGVENFAMYAAKPKAKVVLIAP